MKKILLSCLMLLGIGANAQFTQNFDASTTLPTGWKIITGGDPNSFRIVNAGAQAYSPNNYAGIDYHATAHNDYLVTPAITVATGVNDRLTFWVKSQDASYLENYDVKLSTTNNTSAAAFTVTLKASSAAPGTWTQYFLDLRSYVGQTVYVGFHATDTDKFRLCFDDVVSDKYPVGPPLCTTINAPTAGSTVNGGESMISWAAAANSTGYKLTVGTTSGGSNVYNGTVNGTSQTVALPISSTLYAKVVPTNANGDATGCSEISFSTNTTLAYCTPTINEADHADFEKIKSVTFSNINNSSTSTAVYENFTSVIANVNREKSYPITVGLTDFDFDLISVWIDYNQDGVFSDNERVKLTETMTSTGTIVIPADAKLGNTRMRVRMSRNLGNPACGPASYGQTEDYTVNVEAAMAVNDIKKANVSVYPNPFKDILKISDIKDVKSITVSDASGRMVNSPKVSQELDLSSLKKGVYFVTVSYENGTSETFKAIKE